MRDPYLYDDVPVLRNLFHIHNQELLDNAEADYVVYRLKDLALNPMPGKYDTEHLLQMHN
jgi:cell filamentation protein